MRWIDVTPGEWLLVDDEGNALRHVLRRDPNLGQSTETFTVTGDGFASLEHRSLSQAMAAAEGSLRERP